MLVTVGELQLSALNLCVVFTRISIEALVSVHLAGRCELTCFYSR